MNKVKVVIEDDQDKIKVDSEIMDIIKKAIEISLREEKFKMDCEVDVLLVDNQEIAVINKEHRKIDKATDVLSFPMLDMVEGKINTIDGDVDMDEGLVFLGDLVISLEKTAIQAEDYGHSFQRELAFLVTHGTYHLLGYDHMNEEDEAKMIGKQEQILKIMELSRS